MNMLLTALQQEVHCKLGLCMIRLQQYERIIKTMVAHIAVEGPPGQLQAYHQEQVARASTKTLGTLVGTLTGNYLVPAIPEGVSKDERETIQEPPGEAWVKIDHQLALPPVQYEQVKLRLAELVAMRNTLVHHFLERFDLASEASCAAATAYLTICLEQIADHYLELKNWANVMEQSRASLVSVMQTPEFVDAVFHGILPNGSVHWPCSTIVACLRDAERAYALNGWTLLDSAILVIRSSHSDHTPSRYGCRTWRQVLKKSDQFEVRIDMNPLNGKGQAWYRSREGSVENHGKDS